MSRPFFRPIPSQTELRRASGRRSGSDRGFRRSFLCELSGMPMRSHAPHSRYSRVLRDLPWQGATVELRLDVRRFPSAMHGLFPRHLHRDVTDGLAKYGRQTSRFSETIRLIGYVLGEAGSRLSKRLGMATSPDTVLRRLNSGRLSRSEAPRPWALTIGLGGGGGGQVEGQRYGPTRRSGIACSYRPVAGSFCR